MTSDPRIQTLVLGDGHRGTAIREPAVRPSAIGSLHRVGAAPRAALVAFILGWRVAGINFRSRVSAVGYQVRLFRYRCRFRSCHL